MKTHDVILLLAFISTLSFEVLGFTSFRIPLRLRTSSYQVCAKGPRDLFQEFTVQPCSPETYKEMGIDRWGVWSTRDSPKYKVGIRSPLKVYDCNELSYVTSGKMSITPDEGPNKGVAISVKPGDFVFFPDGFSCY